MKIHIAIVSDQILANLIPALMDRPDKVVLVATTDMAAKRLDRRLADALARAGLATEIVCNAPDVRLAEIHEFAYELLGRLQQENPGASIELNATGGTKPMMLGFVDIFRGDAARILYTDTRHRRIEYFPAPRQPAIPPTPMADVLNVIDYLRAQGFLYRDACSDSPEWRKSAAARKESAKLMGKHAADPDMQNFIGAINSMADKSLDNNGENLIAPIQSLGQKTPWGIWKDMLGKFSKAGLIKWFGDTNIEFPDIEAAHFLRGGWLEEYAWHIVKDAQVSDARMSVTGSWENGREANNEFDVLATHGNQLLFVECKTLRHGRDGSSEKDSDILYKLDSLGRDARGLFGSSWLLSARQPTTEMLDRANGQGIRILGPDELPDLRKVVQQWMATPQ